VLLSETMLAQTQAGRVAARYPALLEGFPTPAALAAAPLGELLRAWSGLGYPRRAAALHAAARAIVERHGGAVPATLGELLALPGIGPYTARAVLAFAFGRPVGVLDTNVGRVLARAWAGRRLARSAAQQHADALTAAAPLAPREWNLAVMDFGALVCRARPACPGCPVRAAGACAWMGAASATPAPAAATPAPAAATPALAGATPALAAATPDPAAGSAGVSGR